MDWKNKSQVREYHRRWRADNKEKVREATRKWYRKNKKRKHKATMIWHKNHPWVVAYNSAKNRCLNPKLHNYHRYGGRGILFNLTRKEVKQLWLRDKAWLLKIPTLDRKDNDGNYELSNCRFIEMHENVARSNKERIKQ